MFILVCLLIIVPCAAAEDEDNIRLAFTQQCLHRTPILQDNDNQNLTDDTVGEGRLFGIFINTTLYWQITESIDTYIADLESDGWRVVLYAAEGGTSHKSNSAQWTAEDFLCELEAARQLRESLKNEYVQGMVGCILTGELPAGWVEDQVGSGTGSPVDLFFRDMDSQWNDTDGNGLLDENLPIEGDCKPEIWMSRLYASSLDDEDEVTLMKNYFSKNHAYRIGELTLPKRALDYIDDKWTSYGFGVRFYDEITQVNDNSTTTASDYLVRLAEGYDLIRVSVHGLRSSYNDDEVGYGHSFENNDKPTTYAYYNQIKNVDPCCFFYDVFSCGTFKWWTTNYMDGWYAFSHSYGLVSWGLLQPHGTEVFYTTISQGKCLGESQLIYLSQWISVDFGMFGDPTLAPGRPRKWSLMYVDISAVGNNSGTNWKDAYHSLQGALSVASWGTEIHVGQGIYMPDKGASVSLGDRVATFQLRNGVVIKGGYEGFGEMDPNARDISLYKTTLSGEIGSPDVNDNSYHIVTANNVGAAAVLDGFTITGSYADINDSNMNDCGGGINMSRSSPTITDCAIINNYAKCGGGMFAESDSRPIINDCQFSYNIAIDGGGSANENFSSPIFNNCHFFENETRSNGGGIYNNYYCNPIMNDCTFINNYAEYGGGMFNDRASPILAKCKFSENQANSNGGGIYNRNYCETLLTNCTFEKNKADGYGGGIYNYFSNPNLTNCIISENLAVLYGGGLYNTFSNSILTNCTISGNSADRGDIIFNQSTSRPSLANCIVWRNKLNEIYDFGDSVTVVSYSDVEGGWSGEGEFNINENPEFTAAENGDYHLRSKAGRWSWARQSWIQDDITSPCIDAGDPNTPIGLEPFPNGGIINMGAYGGTPQASKSITTINSRY